MGHDSVAASVRARKEAHPELFCADRKCLWRLSSGPCPKHPVAIPAPPKGDCQCCGDEFTDSNPQAKGLDTICLSCAQQVFGIYEKALPRPIRSLGGNW